MYVHNFTGLSRVYFTLATFVAVPLFTYIVLIARPLFFSVVLSTRRFQVNFFVRERFIGMCGFRSNVLETAGTNWDIVMICASVVWIKTRRVVWLADCGLMVVSLILILFTYLRKIVRLDSDSDLLCFLF